MGRSLRNVFKSSTIDLLVYFFLVSKQVGTEKQLPERVSIKKTNMEDSFDHNSANDMKWSQRAPTFDNIWHDIFRFLQYELITSYKIGSRPISFLDVGCGTGWAVRYVAKRLEGKGRFVGIDIAKGMIEKAEINSIGIPNIEFYQTSADNLPFESEAFDTAICTNSFHHYKKAKDALTEVRRVLKQEGRIYILDITADDFLIQWIDKWVKTQEKEHVKFYSTSEFTQMFTTARLRHVLSKRVKILYPLKVHVGEKQKN
jgi:ubiquinone/menaquinone biosynthesis C-methylase UbiE